ncbi:MAG: diacylglycerol kinase [Bacteroidetes bacterium]|nr:diacylglycerol kinase [Bacteroidota bacterium]
MKKFSITDRIKSVGYALEGLIVFFKTQHNAWIHVAAAAITIAAGFYLQLGKTDWLMIIIAITLVFITEMFNTAIEFLCDVVSPQIHPGIKKVKDVSAAAVLIAAIAAIAMGIIVFLPRIC